MATTLLPKNWIYNPATGYIELDEETPQAPAPETKVIKCTCGAQSVGSPRHSDWCDVTNDPA